MWQTFFAILGSLGLFIYGMKTMSEGLQKISGENLRNLLQSMTRTRVNGLITGVLVTIAVQSSSATTVMVVGFVNAGLLKLKQAVGVIMGANLGTTATFWLIAIFGFRINITQFALPIVGIGTLCLFARSSRIRDYGQFIVGFGLVFLGLWFLRESIPDVGANPDTYAFLQRFADHGYLSVLLFFVFGIVLTFVVQSSSAAGAISIAMAYKGWIGYDLSAAIILGENIGTTITALIASLGGNRNAKQAALAHFMFNCFGVLWALALFFPFINLIDWILPGNIEEARHLPEHLALFHTMFNLINICLIIGFVDRFTRLVQHLLPAPEGPDMTDRNRLAYLQGQLMDTGELNLVEGQKEVARLASLAEAMFNGFVEVYNEPEKDLSPRVKELKNMEKLSDDLANGISDYLILCSTHKISDRSAMTVSGLLRVVSELEDISDCAYRLILMTRKRYRKNFPITPEAAAAINDFSHYVRQFLQYVGNCLYKEVGAANIEVGLDLERTIDSHRKSLRKEAINRMKHTGQIQVELLYIDMLNQCEKIGNHCLNIIQALERMHRTQN